MDKREERNNAANLDKLTQKWQQVLGQTMDTELRGNIDEQTGKKDNVIKRLVSDLSEVEQQSAMARRSHLKYLDSLQELKEDRLSSLNQQWNSDLEELSSRFNSERERAVEQHQQECANLEEECANLEQHYAKLDIKARQENQSATEAIKIRHLEETYILRLKMEKAIEDVQEQDRQAQRSYTEATHARQTDYKELCTRDQCDAQKIITQISQLEKMQKSISTLRIRLKVTQRENEEAGQQMRATREEASLKTRQLKVQLKRTGAANRSQLTSLVVHSNAAITKLQGTIAKQEKLLRMAELCRKLENEDEKVLPFSICYNKLLQECLCLRREKAEQKKVNQQLKSFSAPVNKQHVVQRKL